MGRESQRDTFFLLLFTAESWRRGLRARLWLICPEWPNVNIFASGARFHLSDPSGTKRIWTYVWRTEAAGVKLSLTEMLITVS
jgi:hypothetical protein